MRPVSEFLCHFLVTVSCGSLFWYLGVVLLSLIVLLLLDLSSIPFFGCFGVVAPLFFSLVFFFFLFLRFSLHVVLWVSRASAISGYCMYGLSS